MNPLTPIMNDLTKPLLLIVDDTDDLVFHDSLYEDSKVLRTFVERKFCLEKKIIQFVSLTVKHRMLILKRSEDFKLKVFAQYDTRYHCVIRIQRDIEVEKYDCDYYIIDLCQFHFILNHVSHYQQADVNDIKYEFLACYDFKQKIGDHYVHNFHDVLGLYTTLFHNFVINNDLFVFGKNVNNKLVPLTDEDKNMCSVYKFKY